MAQRYGFEGSPFHRLVVILGSFMVTTLVLTACDTSCDYHVDYTVPTVSNVFRDDALVRTRVIGFPNVAEFTLEADLDIEEVLVQPGDVTADTLTEGPLRVGAYDDPCGARTGLLFAEDDAVLVVLRWVGPANKTFEPSWRAAWVLSEVASGSVTFLDTGEKLNERIDQILDEPTVSGLIAAILESH